MVATGIGKGMEGAPVTIGTNCMGAKKTERWDIQLNKLILKGLTRW